MRRACPLVVLLLAGCAAPPEAPGIAEASEATPTVDFEAFTSSVSATPTGTCTPDICSDVPVEVLLQVVPFGMRAISLEFNLVARHDTAPVHWQLVCRGSASECASPMGSGWTRGSEALGLRLEGLDLASGTDLVLELYDNRTIIPQWLVDEYTSAETTFDVSGRLGMVPDLVERRPHWVSIDLQGHSGPCTWVADCTHWPGGSWLEVALGSEPVVAFDFRATWDEEFPGQELTVTVGCQRGGAAPPPDTCPEGGEFEFTGTSPLAIKADRFWLFGEDLRLEIYDTLTDGQGGTHTTVTILGQYLEMEPVTPRA